MKLALYLLAGLAALLAWIVAQRRPDHRPVAAALSLALAANLGRAALIAWVLPPPDQGPFHGALRLAIAADRALYLAWPALVAALALTTLARRRAWPVAIAHGAIVLALALTYPATRFDTLRRFYLAAELAAALVGVASAASWYRRARPANVTTLAAAFLVAGHLATVIAGPYRFGLFGEAWILATWIYLAVMTTLILLHLGSLWTAEQ